MDANKSCQFTRNLKLVNKITCFIEVVYAWQDSQSLTVVFYFGNEKYKSNRNICGSCIQPSLP